MIGVNSGTAPVELARYVRENHITIPVIIDADRSLERASGVGVVSLKNIWRAVEIGPEGSFRQVDGSNLPASLQAAAATGSWNIDPATLPVALMPLWKQLEFGNYANTAKLLNRQIQTRDPVLKLTGSMGSTNISSMTLVSGKFCRKT